MESIAQVKIIGFKHWVSADKKLDVGSIFIEANLKNSKKGVEGFGGEMGQGFAKGYAAREMKCLSSEIVRRIQHLDTPLSAQITYDSETDGKGLNVEVVLDIRPTPVEVNAPVKKAA